MPLSERLLRGRKSHLRDLSNSIEKPSGTRAVSEAGMLTLVAAAMSYPVECSVARCGNTASGCNFLILT